MRELLFKLRGRAAEAQRLAAFLKQMNIKSRNAEQSQKMMKTRLITVVALLSIVPITSWLGGEAMAQSDTPKREVGAQISVLGIKDAHGLTDIFPRTEVGVGGRFTCNLKRYLALEAELISSLEIFENLRLILPVDGCWKDCLE
jgi:hypothetical protein